MATQSTDFTKGNIAGRMLRVSLPFLATGFLQALCGIADLLLVGRGVGPLGISALQAGGQVVTLLTNISLGLSVAATVLVAHALGAGKDDEKNKVIGSMMTLFLLFSLVATAGLCFGKNQILSWLNTPQEVVSQAGEYLWVSSLGLIFVFGQNLISAVLRASGKVIAPLVFAAVGLALHVGLEWVLVTALGLGPQGAAWSGLAAQGVSFFIACLYFARGGWFDFRPSSFRLHRDTLVQVLRVGIPSGVQFSVTGLSFLMLTSLSNRAAGAVGSALLGIGNRINAFGILPCSALSASVTAVAGQNLGAQKPHRATRAFWVGCGLALGFSSLFFLAVQCWPEGFLRLFLNLSGRAGGELAESCLTMGVPYLRRISFDPLFAAFFFCANGLANASGQTWFTLLNCTVNSLAVRLPLAYLFVFFGASGDLNGIGTAIGFSAIPSVMIGLFYLLKGGWKRKNALSPKNGGRDVL